MSLPFPLSAFATLADGQPLACIQGTLTKLFDQKRGTSSVGDWTLQNGEITFEGTTIPITFKDRDPLDKRMKDKTILLTASNSQGLKGLYCWDDTRNNTTVRKLKVTAAATLDIIEDGGRPAASQKPDTKLQQAEPERKPEPRQKPRSAPSEAADSLNEARRTIQQIANLHLLAALAVEKFEAPAFKARTGVDMTESQRQGATASIFIAADKMGISRNMPIHPLDLDS